MRRRPGLNVIIAWKLVRAGLSLIGGAALLVLTLTGFEAHLGHFAATLHSQAVSAFAVSLTGLLVSAVEPAHAMLVAGVLGLDGVMLLVEGWALFKGWWWAAWLVVVATSALVPFEVVSIARHPGLWRVLALLVNLGIVAYFVLDALSRRSRAAAATPL
jgi:uncharacterized membrane protein (DUF2068 family)